MKNTGKTQVNAYRGFRKGGLIKWLSGFFAVLIAVTMLSGQTVPFYGNELDSYRTRLRRVSTASRKKAEDYLEQLRRALETAEGLNRVRPAHVPGALPGLLRESGASG